MATKPKPAASGFQIFRKPGGSERAAINLETGTVVETDGKNVAFFIHGARHVVETSQTLEELTGAEEEEAGED